MEVLSPGTARTDRSTKRQLYARHGVPHYWIVDPAGRTIEAHALAGQSYGPPARFDSHHLVDLPPFVGLTLGPDVLWP